MRYPARPRGLLPRSGAVARLRARRGCSLGRGPRRAKSGVVILRMTSAPPGPMGPPYRRAPWPIPPPVRWPASWAPGCFRFCGVRRSLAPLRSRPAPAAPPAPLAGGVCLVSACGPRLRRLAWAGCGPRLFSAFAPAGARRPPLAPPLPLRRSWLGLGLDQGGRGLGFRRSLAPLRSRPAPAAPAGAVGVARLRARAANRRVCILSNSCSIVRG